MPAAVALRSSPTPARCREPVLSLPAGDVLGVSTAGRRALRGAPAHAARWRPTIQQAADRHTAGLRQSPASSAVLVNADATRPAQGRSPDRVRTSRSAPACWSGRFGSSSLNSSGGLFDLSPRVANGGFGIVDPVDESQQPAPIAPTPHPPRRRSRERSDRLGGDAGGTTRQLIAHFVRGSVCVEAQARHSPKGNR